MAPPFVCAAPGPWHRSQVTPESEKGGFAKMVSAAKAALLAGEDPHEAAEDVLGGEPENEAPVIKAVEKALSQLKVTDPNAEATEA